jgi:hypothetical protein
VGLPPRTPTRAPQPSLPSPTPPPDQSLVRVSGVLPSVTQPASIQGAVLAYDWPCWAAVLACFPVVNCRIFSRCMSIPLVGFSPLPEEPLYLPPACNHLFISGPWSFVQPYWTAFSAHIPVTVALDLHSSPPDSLSGRWFRLRHVDYGGVSNGSWHVGSSAPTADSITSQLTPLPLSRYLLHVLSPVQKGPLVNPPAAIDSSDTVVRVKNLVSPFGLWPVDDPESQCVCPYVVGKAKSPEGGWIRRSLLLSELLQIFDVPVDLGKPIAAFAENNAAHRAFMQSAPSKILMPFARALLERVSPPPLSEESKLWGSSEHSSQVELRSETSQQAPWSPEEDGRQRAAKADDADIPYELWDSPFWNVCCLWAGQSLLLTGACILDRQNHLPVWWTYYVLGCCGCGDAECTKVSWYT